MLRPAQPEAGEPAALAKLEPKPRADETCRALLALRGAIDRRLAEAQAHRAAGRLRDAIRGFESVLVLDRQNQIAQGGACASCAQRSNAGRRNTWSRMFGRLFRGRSTTLSARDGVLMTGPDIRCSKCNRGSLLLVGQAGRRVQVEGASVEVPRDFLIPTCRPLRRRATR